MRPLFSALALFLAVSIGCAEANPPLFQDKTDAGPRDDLPSSDAAEVGSKDGAVAGDVACAPGSTRCADRCVDLQTEVSSCGVCGRDCLALPGVDRDLVRCRAGRCDLTLACLPGRAACTGEEAGCASDVTTADRCGACTVRCSGVMPLCVFRAEGDAGAGTYVCSDGCPTATPTRCGTQCVDVNTSTTSCGACGTACSSRAGSRASCVMGQCRVECLAGYADCDGVPTNGCEALLASSLTHCGRCGNACTAPPGRTAACMAGVCVANCPTGFADCDGDMANGCESNTRTSAVHCGRCDNPCVAGPNATNICSSGFCRNTCAAGFGDCDGSVANGCEVDVRTAMTACGGCGRVCNIPAEGAATCAAGVCAITCRAGFFLSGVSCLAIPPPQPVTPPPGFVVTTTRPTFEWRLTAPSTGARVEVCRDRACVDVVRALTVTGTSSTPGADLPPGVYFWRSFGRRDAAEGLAASPVWSFIVGPNSTAVDSFWGPVFDADGNGGGDLAVGSAAGATSVTVFASRGAGLTPAATVIAPAGTTQFGRSLANADVNGDGYSDLIVGVAAGESRAFVYAGTATGIGGMVAPISGPTDFGASIANAGDVNRDGFGDVIFGNPAMDRALVYFGAPTGLTSFPSVSLTTAAMNTFGSSVAGGFDLNGDRFSDVIVGAPGANRAVVFLGSRLGLSAVAIPVTATGAATTDYGAAVAAAGDVNGDGRGDVLVAAPGSGRVDVLGGVAGSPPLGLLSTLTGEAGSGFGAAVAGVGDLDRDGFCDIVVAAPTARELRVYRGSPAGVLATPTVVLRGDAGGGYTTAVTSVGDTNNDGRFELAAGFTGGNVVRVFAGAASGLLAPTPLPLTPGVGPVAAFTGALH